MGCAIERERERERFMLRDNSNRDIYNIGNYPTPILIRVCITPLTLDIKIKYTEIRIRDTSSRDFGKLINRREKKIFSRGRENTAGKLSRRVISVFIFDGKERAEQFLESRVQRGGWCPGGGCPRVHSRRALSFRGASYRSVIKNDKGKWDRGAALASRARAVQAEYKLLARCT